MNTDPMINKIGVFNIQVCVPTTWSDEQVKEYADRAHQCGTTNGWFVRKQTDYTRSTDLERCPCEERKDFVHIVLDA